MSAGSEGCLRIAIMGCLLLGSAHANPHEAVPAACPDGASNLDVDSAEVEADAAGLLQTNLNQRRVARAPPEVGRASGVDSLLQRRKGGSSKAGRSGLSGALEQCRDSLGAPGGAACELPAGVYRVGETVDFDGQAGTIRAAQGADVVIDGTAELRPTRSWKPCEQLGRFSSRCAPGVMVARVNEDVYQLFASPRGTADGDLTARRLLIPARWPNENASANPSVADAPAWASVYDTRTTWSFVSTGNHSSDDKVTGHGWLEDNGGGEMRVRVEVEQGKFEWVTRRGSQYLRDAGFDAEGAVVVVNWGKQMSEAGLVHEHAGDRISFRAIPCPGGDIVPYRVPPYHSCSSRPFIKLNRTGHEQGMLSYFLTQKLELLDQEGEWHFEHRGAGRGGWLFVKLAGDIADYTFHGRVLRGPALRFTNAAGDISVEGISFFGGYVQAKRCPNFRLSNNTFLFSSAAPRTLVDSSASPILSAPESNLLEQVDNAHIVDNVFRFSEGKAIEFLGENVTFENNLVEWNGFNGIDGPGTVKIAKQPNNVLRRNTLRWNGQVTGLFMNGPGGSVEYNLIDHQNWGGLQHDGAGIHVPIKGQSSRFSFNWISNGDHSMAIRFDTASSTELGDVGTNGTVTQNVAWGGPTIVIKGESHAVERNTVIGNIEIVRGFGAACGMNQRTTTAFNAATSLTSRNCTDDDGVPWEGLPAATHSNTIVRELCDELRSCGASDFRPVAASAVAGDGSGAYATGLASYWVPGRLAEQPAMPIPADGASVWHATTELIFLPARASAPGGAGGVAACASHRVFLSTIQGRVEAMAGNRMKRTVLDGGANIWAPGLRKNKQYYWRVQPLCDGAEASPVWTFTTLLATTSTTTTTATTRVGPVLIREGYRCKGGNDGVIPNIASAAECAQQLGGSSNFFTWCTNKKCVVEKRDCTGDMRAQSMCSFYRKP